MKKGRFLSLAEIGNISRFLSLVEIVIKVDFKSSLLVILTDGLYYNYVNTNIKCYSLNLSILHTNVVSK